MYAKIGAIVAAAAVVAAIMVTLAGGATAANQRAHAVKHQNHTTARLENPGTRDVGFTG